MEEKVLVTGASGLIGFELCKQLHQQGYNVTAVDSGFRYHDKPDCNYFVKKNVIEFVESSHNDFNYIFHMGNINGTKYFYTIPNKLIKNNIKTDFAVFDYANKNSKCKLIYASSSEVIAGTNTFPTKEYNTITIENIHNPRWSYRLGKLVAENYLVNSNLNYLIIRFFNVYGERSGEGHFVRDILDKLNKNNYEIIGSDETRCFCYVADAVDAVLKIKGTPNEIVNVASDEEIKILDAANLIARSINKKNIQWKTIKSLEGSVKRRKPDLSKLKKLYPSFRPKLFKDVLNNIEFKK